MADTNIKTIKNLYINCKHFYELFETLVDTDTICSCDFDGYNSNKRLKILNEFFMLYKYPKLEELGNNIIEHEGEDGPYDAHLFIRYSYESFMKETDPVLYNIYRHSEDIWRDQSAITDILSKAKKPIKPEEPREPSGESLNESSL